MQRGVDIQRLSAGLAQEAASIAAGGNYEEALTLAKQGRKLVAARVETKKDRELLRLFDRTVSSISESLEQEKRNEVRT